MPHNNHCCITSPGVTYHTRILTSKSMSALLLLTAKLETRPWFSSRQYPKLLPWNSSLTHEIAKRRQLLRNWVIKLSNIYATKKRNAPLRNVQLSGRSHVICQFSLYQCKCMSGTAASQGVEIVLKKIGHEQSGGQIVKSQEISVFIMLSCWISSSNWNHLS